MKLAIAAVHRRNTRMVIDVVSTTTVLKGRAFLRAMAQDEGPSRTTDIGHRLGDARNTMGNYRARLIDAGLIESVGRGLVDFAIAGLREQLRF